MIERIINFALRQLDAGSWDAGQPRAGDTVLLDPPRAGLPERLSASLAQSRAGTIVLIGCDGAAFCRDVKRLEAGGGFALSRLAVLDLFPNTAQAEFVGLLRR